MARIGFMLIFAAVAVLVLGSVHYYLYRRLVVAPALPAPWPTVAKIALITLASGVPLSLILSRLIDNGIARYFVYPIYVWLGLMLMLFFLLLAIDLVQGLGWLGARAAGRSGLVTDPQRRLLLARVIAGTAGGTVLTAAAFAMKRGLGKLAVKRLEISLPKLPAALDGTTIAQITDLHLGPMRGRDWMAEVVERVNGLKPDLVAVTGDLVDGTVAQLADDVAPLTELKAPHGTFFVTGNHEYFVEPEAWLKHLRKIGIRVLENDRVTIGKPGAAFELAGVNDHDAARLSPKHAPDVGKAVRGSDPTHAVVLLAHQPRVIDDAVAAKVDLVLSGHTHGGQIWPWYYLVYLQQPYVRGLHRRGSTHIYVSSGTGFWGPPMRLGSTAEITLVTLRAAPQKEKKP